MHRVHRHPEHAAGSDTAVECIVRGGTAPWFFEWPSDGFSLSLCQRFVVDQPCLSRHRVAQHGHGGISLVKLSERYGSMYVPHWSGADPEDLQVTCASIGTVSTASAALQEALPGVEVCLQQIPALLIPRPIFEFIIRRRLHKLLCLARWVRILSVVSFPHPFGNWPAADWIRARPSLHAPPIEEEPWQPEPIGDIAEMIRRHSHRLLEKVHYCDSLIFERAQSVRECWSLLVFASQR